MISTLLIKLDDILHYTSISPRIDEYNINPHILNAQILYLEPILGSNLYEKMLDLVSTNDITGSTYTNYNTLLEYIKPSLVYHTLELYIPLNSFKITDGGVFQHQMTNANLSPYDEIEKVSNKYRILGNKYDDKLNQYLCKNSSLFEEYINNTGLIKKTEVTQRSGWYLGMSNSQSKIRK